MKISASGFRSIAFGSRLRLPISVSWVSGSRKPGAGSRRSSSFLDERRNWLFLGDDALADLLLARQVVHQIEHQVLDDHTQAARTDLAGERLFGDGIEGVVGE